ncbi:hypothetical protein [Rubellimicrobium thermophilum]|uniref:hypothetical protein n=1 Tax=Rubellimicrobium thermophilum TaxID=295419 RepID=UPI000404B5AA
MRDILTVTLNPALDFATSVDHVIPGVKLRCAPPGRIRGAAASMSAGRSVCWAAPPGPSSPWAAATAPPSPS